MGGSAGDAPDPRKITVAMVWILAIAVASIAPYALSLGGVFVLDDEYLIVRDPLAHSLANVGRAFTTYFLHGYRGTESLYYRPLITLSYQLNYSCSGADPFIFRLTNVLLHALAAVLVFMIARRLTGNTLAAGVAGVAFGVLPSHAQSVAWIAGRTDVIASVFMLGSFLAFLAARDTPAGFSRPLAALCSLLFGCALFSKESAMVLPILLLAYAWAFGPAPRRGEMLRWTAVLVLPAIAYIAMRYHVLGLLVDDSEPSLLKERLLRAGAAYATYLRLLFVPQEVRVYHGHLHSGLQISAIGLAAWAIPAGLAVFAVWMRKRTPAVAFGAAWILIGLLPASDIIPTRTLLPSERFVYLASVGSSMVIGWLVWRAYEFRPRNLRTLPVAVVLLALGYAFYSGMMTYINSESYKTNLAWARLIARTNPPHQELRLLAARYLSDADCPAEAAGEYEAGIRLSARPLSGTQAARLAYQAGRLYASGGDTAKAERAFLRAVRARPDFREAWLQLFELSRAYAALGRTEQASRLLRRIIAESPDSGLVESAEGVIGELGRSLE